MGGAFNIWKHGECKRKDVCFICDKKYRASEHVEIMSVSGQGHYGNKKINVSTKQDYVVKLCMRLKKIESENNCSIERGFPNSSCFHH